jgi:hypothetical protein
LQALGVVVLDVFWQHVQHGHKHAMTSLFAGVSLSHKNKAAAIMKIKTMKKRQRYKFILTFSFLEINL